MVIAIKPIANQRIVFANVANQQRRSRALNLLVRLLICDVLVVDGICLDCSDRWGLPIRFDGWSHNGCIIGIGRLLDVKVNAYNS